jgi:hypothetical protein
MPKVVLNDHESLRDCLQGQLSLSIGDLIEINDRVHMGLLNPRTNQEAVSLRILGGKIDRIISSLRREKEELAREVSRETRLAKLSVVQNNEK